MAGFGAGFVLSLSVVPVLIVLVPPSCASLSPLQPALGHLLRLSWFLAEMLWFSDLPVCLKLLWVCGMVDHSILIFVIVRHFKAVISKVRLHLSWFVRYVLTLPPVTVVQSRELKRVS